MDGFSPFNMSTVQGYRNPDIVQTHRRSVSPNKLPIKSKSVRCTGWVHLTDRSGGIAGPFCFNVLEVIADNAAPSQKEIR